MTATEAGYWALFVAWLVLPVLATAGACWWSNRIERQSDRPTEDDTTDDARGNISTGHIAEEHR
jgi:hypothetical protein